MSPQQTFGSGFGRSPAGCPGPRRSLGSNIHGSIGKDAARAAPGGARLIFLLALAGIFISAPLALGQINLVQVVSCGPASFPGTSCTINATHGGDLIVVALQGGGNTATIVNSVTDNVGNTYVEAGSAHSNDTTSNWNDIWYVKNSIPGASSIVVTPSAVVPGGVVIWEFSGVDTISPLDQTAILNSQAATANVTGAPVTTSAPSEVLISLADPGAMVNGITSGNPFVNDSALMNDGWAHYITTSTGTYSAQWNQSAAATYSSSTASFKAAGNLSACDLDQSGTVDIVDVQWATDMALGTRTCGAPGGFCNLAFAQAVLNNAMGGACVLPALLVPAGVTFGNVTVGSNSTQTVTLTGSGNASTTITQANVSGTGFGISGLTVPLTIPAGQSASFTVIFTPQSAGSASGTISFLSNALDTPANQTLSGTGTSTPPQHYVSLSWNGASTDASYNIYRITASSPTASQPATPYPSLGTALGSCNPANPPSCTYTDSNVQAGTTYWYYTTAVAGGVESSPSNIAGPATVPSP